MRESEGRIRAWTSRHLIYPLASGAGSGDLGFTRAGNDGAQAAFPGAIPTDLSAATLFVRYRAIPYLAVRFSRTACRMH